MGIWTDQGFVTKPKSYYEDVIRQAFVSAFGDDFALDETLPQGVLISRLAELFYGMDMDGVEAFSRLNVNTVAGRFLDIFGARRGIPRILGAPQTGTLAITLVPGASTPFTIPEGTIFTVSNGTDTFEIDAITTVTANTNISVHYTQDGNSSAVVGDTLTVEGLPQIQNIEIISLYNGTEDEADLAYRQRIINEYPGAKGTIEQVMSVLKAIPSVRSVGVAYNDTDTTDVDGVPAYCTEWLVAPKSDVGVDELPTFKNAVGTAIVNNKVPGAPTYGNTTVTVYDKFGGQKTVNFSIADKVELEIVVTVATPETTGILDLSHFGEIKEVIANYINSLGIGMNVSYSRCLAPLAADTGFDVISFKIKDKTSAVWVTNSNFVVNAREYASIDPEDITREF